MDGAVFSAVIRPIDRGVVHKICSGQVILDLPSAVKELVENSLDACASSIEINLFEYGEKSFKVADNGCGISPNNFQVIALKHHTSKIVDFSDLQALTFLGFRGEALSSLCSLANLIIETRTKNEMVGTHLEFDHSGSVVSERKIARQIGTTVTAEKLFGTLPVRCKEFSRNIRKEYGKLISLLNAYAVIGKGLRLVCTNTTSRNGKSVVLSTQGNDSVKDNITAVFGSNTMVCLEPIDIAISANCKVEGFLSKPGNGSGRNLGDRQIFYVNGRPIDMPKVSKLLNEIYRSTNPRQFPIAILNFIVPPHAYDVNITPDKRKVFFSNEDSLINSLRNAVSNLYSPIQCIYPINHLKESTETRNDASHANMSGKAETSASPELMSAEESGRSNEPVILNSESGRSNEPVILNSESGRSSEPEILNSESGRSCESDILNSHVEESSMHNKRHASLFDANAIISLSSYREGVSKNSSGHQSKPSTSRMSNLARPSHLIQSSLTHFATVNKRKLGNGGLLSEMPILRNEMSRCQTLKIDSSALDDRYPRIDSRKHKDTDLPPNGRIVNASSESEMLSHDEPDTCEEESKEETLEAYGKDLPCISLHLEASHMKEIEDISYDFPGKAPLSDSSNVTLDEPVLNSAPENCFVLEFSINDIITRRQEKWSIFFSNCASDERLKTNRCYTAATLSSQLENEEGKVRALAAATTELERFFRKEDFGRMQVIGQFNLGFIIGKVDNDLFIVDQHAADERYNFERLCQSTVMNQQPLFQPIKLELSPEEEVVASMHMNVLRKNGFTLIEDVNASSGSQYLLKAVPFSKNIIFGVEDVKELISILADSQEECTIISSYKLDDPSSVCPSRVRGMLASRACRSSVMIGDPLGRKEMQKILQHLAILKSPWNCPHGRPTMRHLVDLATIYKKEAYEQLST